MGTPRQFGVFSVFLVSYYVIVGFNRAVPHAVAMTLEWEDERARNGYFFFPAWVLGGLGALVLVPIMAILEPSFALLPIFLLPLLLQDAVRMHSFALHKPGTAIASDTIWLAIELIGFALVSTPAAAALVWAGASMCGALVVRPWLQMRWVRRPVTVSIVSSALEYLVLGGFGILAPLFAGFIISIRGVGALQGANVFRGPVTLLVQGLVAHTMAGPPISRDSCSREALSLSGIIAVATLVFVAPIVVLKDVYGPFLLGPTWPLVDPLIYPTVLSLGVCSTAFGPATVIRKMGLFRLSATVQIALTPCFVAFALLGAAQAGAEGFVNGTTVAYGISATVWWTVLAFVGRAGRPS